ncbi:unnamed protein product, partial [Onchocerca ochengi]
EKTSTTIVSPSNGLTLRTVRPNSSVANGSRAMVWFAAKIFRSNTIFKVINGRNDRNIINYDCTIAPVYIIYSCRLY